ncbi:MAG: hypothetical protein ABIJ50_08230, partial [Pseudomonadota bacterium]
TVLNSAEKTAQLIAAMSIVFCAFYANFKCIVSVMLLAETPNSRYDKKNSINSIVESLSMICCWACAQFFLSNFLDGAS